MGSAQRVGKDTQDLEYPITLGGLRPIDLRRLPMLEAAHTAAAASLHRIAQTRNRGFSPQVTERFIHNRLLETAVLIRELF